MAGWQLCFMPHFLTFYLTNPAAVVSIMFPFGNLIKTSLACASTLWTNPSSSMTSLDQVDGRLLTLSWNRRRSKTGSVAHSLILACFGHRILIQKTMLRVY